MSTPPTNSPYRRGIPYKLLTPAERMERIALQSRKPKIPPPTAPAGRLRDEWSYTTFPPPMCTIDSCLDAQSLWAAKKATVAIHRALRSNDWSTITPLTVSLSIADRVMQLNLYARFGKTEYLTAPQWLANRERDIRRTYDEFNVPVPMPCFEDARFLAFFTLRWTYLSPHDAMARFPKIESTRDIATANGSVFGHYAPVLSDLEEYGCRLRT